MFLNCISASVILVCIHINKHHLLTFTKSSEHTQQMGKKKTSENNTSSAATKKSVENKTKEIVNNNNDEKKTFSSTVGEQFFHPDEVALPIVPDGMQPNQLLNELSWISRLFLAIYLYALLHGLTMAYRGELN